MNSSEIEGIIMFSLNLLEKCGLPILAKSGKEAIFKFTELYIPLEKEVEKKLIQYNHTLMSEIDKTSHKPTKHSRINQEITKNREEIMRQNYKRINQIYKRWRTNPLEFESIK